MYEPRLVDDAPRAVDPKHGQIVAVPLTGVLSPESHQSLVTLEQETIDPPQGGPEFRSGPLLALGDELLQRQPLQLPLIVADDAGTWMERSQEQRLVACDHPHVVRTRDFGHRRDVLLVGLPPAHTCVPPGEAGHSASQEKVPAGLKCQYPRTGSGRATIWSAFSAHVAGILCPC